MRFVTCSICGNDKSPTNATLMIDDVTHCEHCLKEKFPADADLKGKRVVQQFDPTICTNCSKDYGDIPLKLRGSYPMCENCETVVQERIFPTWVKAFFAGVVALVIFSLVWNWRFVEAYYLIKRTESLPPPDGPTSFYEAATLYGDIYAKVPELDEFRQLANYSKGVWLLSDDKGAEALKAFKNCVGLPDSYGLENLTLQAEIGASFDSKNYTGFVDASKRLLRYDSSAVSLAQVASAYACLYAVQESDSSKTAAMDYLQRAINLNDTTRFFANYINRIEYRLATGDIIDKKVFDAKFPNGWTK
jgi:hypothetical protein